MSIYGDNIFKEDYYDDLNKTKSFIKDMNDRHKENEKEIVNIKF